MTSIIRVDASKNAAFKADYYLKGKTVSTYHPDETSARTWLRAELERLESDGLIWLESSPTTTGVEVHNLFNKHDLIWGIAVEAAAQSRNPTVVAALPTASRPVRYKSWSFGGKRTFGDAFSQACLAFVHHHGLKRAHLERMLEAGGRYLSYYECDLYEIEGDLEGWARIALEQFDASIAEISVA